MLPLNECEMSYLWRVENLNQSEIQVKFSLAFKTKMSRGRPRKCVLTRNMTGLCNQNSVSTNAAGYVSSPNISEPDKEECLHQSKWAQQALPSSTPSLDTSDDEENDWQHVLKSHVHPAQYIDGVCTSMRYLQTTCSVDLVIVLFRVDNTCHTLCCI